MIPKQQYTIEFKKLAVTHARAHAADRRTDAGVDPRPSGGTPGSRRQSENGEGVAGARGPG